MPDINIKITDDGATMTGAPGVSVETESRENPDDGALQVRWTVTPVGDGAEFAGTLTVVASLSKPEVSNDDEAETAAKYAASCIGIVGDIVKEQIVTAFGEAAAKSSDDGKALRMGVHAMASLLLTMNGGDPEKAKEQAGLMAHGKASITAESLGLSESDVADCIAAVREVIDATAGVKA